LAQHLFICRRIYNFARKFLNISAGTVKPAPLFRHKKKRAKPTFKSLSADKCRRYASEIKRRKNMLQRPPELKETVSRCNTTTALPVKEEESGLSMDQI
jgi:hypothetical protein